MVGLSGVLGAAASAFAIPLANVFSGPWRWGCHAMVCLVVGLVVYQVQLFLVRIYLRIHLVDAARSERLPLCMQCGYNLEGLASDRCPECGRSRLGPRVIPQKPGEASRI